MDKIWGTEAWSLIYWLKGSFNICHMKSFQILGWAKLSIILLTIIIIISVLPTFIEHLHILMSASVRHRGHSKTKTKSVASWSVHFRQNNINK